MKAKRQGVERKTELISKRRIKIACQETDFRLSPLGHEQTFFPQILRNLTLYIGERSNRRKESFLDSMLKRLTRQRALDGN